MSQTKAQLLDTLVASLLPASDSSVDIGSNAVRFANIYGDTLYGNGANLTGINTDLVSDTSPQLGGNLDVNTKNILFGDSASASDDRLIFGDGSDLQIFHNGTDSRITDAGTGSLALGGSAVFIQNAAHSENMIRAVADGGVDLYYDGSNKLHTTSTGVNITGVTVDDGATHDGPVTFLGASHSVDWTKSGNMFVFDDDAQAKFGDDGDFSIRHASGTSILDVITQNNFEINHGSENIAKFIPDGAVELYHDNSKKFETTSSGISVTGEIQTTGHIRLPDNMSLIAGDGNDLFIFHNGSHSRILDSGAGKLQLGSDTEVEILNGSFNETMAKFIPNGAVELYHDNSKIFSTEANGIQVLAKEGFSAFLRVYADEGDDNADKYWLKTEQDGTGFHIQNLVSGSTENNFRTVGNGTTELYYDNSKKLETTSTGIYVDGDIDGIPDGSKILVGTHDDIQIFHQTNASYIKASNHTIHLDSGTTSAIKIISAGSTTYGTMANFNTDGSVELYYDGSKKFETTSDGVMVLNSSTNARINFNAASGTRGYVYADNANNIGFLDANANDWMVKCSTDAAVELYHDGSKKVETISAGIRVTGDYVGDNDWIKVSKLTSYDTTKSPIQQNSKTYWYTRLDDANSIQSSEFRNLAGSGGNSNSFQSTIIPVDNMTRQSDAGSFSAYNSSTNTQATRTNMAGADDFNIATKGLSMGCLVRLENTGSNGSGIIFYGDGDTEDHFFSRYKYNGHGLMIGEDTNGSDNWTAAYPTSFFNDGEWRFVVMAVATNGTLMVSINGDRLTPVRLTGSVPTPDNAHFGIQGDTYNDNAARHRFATFWWYEGVISDALVAQEYAWLKTIWTSASGLT